jgi:hypothetical protein
VLPIREENALPVCQRISSLQHELSRSIAGKQIQRESFRIQFVQVKSRSDLQVQNFRMLSMAASCLTASPLVQKRDVEEESFRLETPTPRHGLEPPPLPSPMGSAEGVKSLSSEAAAEGKEARTCGPASAAGTSATATEAAHS